jgi:sirohydrochlorin ferrochelatase
MKYCPLCDAEYSETHTRCTVCGVELVPDELRGRPLDERQRKERIELVWRGGDPGAVSQVIETLREAGIRHHVQPTNDHFVFELGMPRPKYVVRAFASDAARARELLAGIHEASPFVSMEASALALAEEPLEQGPSRRREWRPTAATSEIWSGEDAALAQLLEDCLRENGIGVRCEGKPPGIMHLRVMPPDEAAAREIVREVWEASPPA